MNKKIYILWVIISVLIVTGVFIYLKTSGDALDPSDYVSGTAAVCIVILTAAYVTISSMQLKAMKSQLDEMKKDREVTSQPMIYVTPKKILLQKPKLYFSPPIKEYAGHCRLHIDCGVINQGNGPGLSVTICACLVLPGTNRSDCDSAENDRKYIAVVPTNASIESEQHIHLMFVDDTKGLVIEALRALRHDRLPKLSICAVYKNVLGGCFACRQKYNLHYDFENNDSILENWQARIAAFDSLLKNEIRDMNKQREKNAVLHNNMLKQAKKKYEEGIKGEDQELYAAPIPLGFEAFSISERIYKNIATKGGYGSIILDKGQCLALSEGE